MMSLHILLILFLFLLSLFNKLVRLIFPYQLDFIDQTRQKKDERFPKNPNQLTLLGLNSAILTVTQPPWLVPSTNAFSTPNFSITCKFIAAVSQYVQCSTLWARVCPWPSSSIASKFILLVRALSLKKGSYSAAEVRKEFTSTRVGLLESKGVERRYEAVMPPRCGTVIVCVSGILG